MPVRTNDTRVREALQGDYDRAQAPPLTRAIKAASLIVDRVRQCATDKPWPLTAEELVEIETWVAAHVYAVSGTIFASRQTAAAGPPGPKPHAVGMRLEETEYGRMALLLDTSGCLQAFNRRQTAGGFWLGKTLPEQQSYEERNS